MVFNMTSPLEKYRKHALLHVTDLSSQLWCEKQVELSLIYEREATEAIKIGRKIHDQLHREVVEVVQVQSYTNNDRMAIVLHRMLMGAFRLIKKRITREMPVFGKVDKLFIMGEIDELQIKNKNLFLIDNKTRIKNRRPTLAQIKKDEFQLMLYYSLLNDSINKKFKHNNFLKYFQIRKSEKISDEFKQELKDKKLNIEVNLHKLAKDSYLSVQKLPKLSDILTLIYTHQETGALIYTHEFKYNYQRYKENVNFVVPFWLGERKAIPVNENNRWKCRICDLSDKCDVLG